VSLVGELAGGMAHELSQPLAAIANTLEACATRLPATDPRAKVLRPLLKHATAQAVQAGRIIRNVRDLIRRHQPPKELTDIRGLVDAAATLLTGDVTEHRIDLRLALGDKPLHVLVSRIEIEQVVLNLLRNAIDAIRQAGRKRRELTVKVSRTAARTVEVAVRDTGTGITEVVARRMFEPFFTTKSDGLGMGLAICRSIVEAHGGRLWVASRERRRGGTTLRFTLPLERERGLRKRRARRGAR
jgi:two-component system, LuxR family, sensor kinase FixL